MAKFNCLFCFTFLILFISSLNLTRSEQNFKDLTKHKNWPLLDFGTSCGRRIRDYEIYQSAVEIKGRILGGRDAESHEFPWLVLLQIFRIFPGGRISNMYSGLCGGSVINDRYILTAAHCCQQPADEVFERRVFVKLNGDADNTDRPLAVEHVRIHDKFNKDSLLNDICLVRLEKPIKFSGNVQPICLPSDRKWRTKRLAGLNMTIAGWSEMSDEPTLPDRLQKVDISIVPINRCIRHWSNFKHPVKVYARSQFCGGNAVKDACVGDSGGPVMYKSHERPPRYYLLGLVSFGQQCIANKTTEPSVFVRVPNYMSWILDNIYE